MIERTAEEACIAEVSCYNPSFPVTKLFTSLKKLKQASEQIQLETGTKCPLYMLQMFIAACRCPKGILGLRGWGGPSASKNKLKDSNDKHHNFRCISYACAEGIR